MTKNEFLWEAAYEDMTDEQIRDGFHRFYVDSEKSERMFEMDLTMISCATRAKELREIVINE